MGKLYFVFTVFKKHGLSKIQPAGHMRPAKNFNVANDHFSGFQYIFYLMKHENFLLFWKTEN